MARALFPALKIISAGTLLGAFLLVTLITIDPDLGIHLAVGRWELENHAVPRADIYTHTMPGYEWVNHEWLLDAVLAWMHDQGLEYVLVILFTLLAATPFLLWLYRSERYEDVWAIFLAGVATLGLLGVRLQILSFVLVFLVLEMYEYYVRHRQEKRGRNVFLLFIPFFFIWANLHGGFFSGLILLGLLMFGDWLADLRAVRRFTLPWFEVGVLAVSALVTLINPYGARLYGLIFETMRSPEVSRYIAEWLSPFKTTNIVMNAYIGLFLFLAVKFYRRYPLRLTFAAAFFFVSFMKSVRLWFSFLIPAVPLVALGFGEVRKEIEEAEKRQPLRKTARRRILIIAACLFLLVPGVLMYRVASYNPLPYPEQAVRLLKEKKAKGEDVILLNDYGWGGYLLSHAPEIKVFIDGRMPSWVDKSGNSAMKDYVKIFYEGDKQERFEVLERREITTVLIRNTKVGGPEESPRNKESFSGIAAFFKENRFAGKILNLLIGETRTSWLKEDLLDAGWRLVYEDEVAVILECGSVCRE